jgi:hypothetical protein
MALTKFNKMTRYLPSLYKPEANPFIRGLLTSWAGEDDLIVQAVVDAKEQLFVATAQLGFLDALGSNVGVFRPTDFNLPDELFRQLIPALSFAPKQVIPTIKRVLDVFFGVGNPRVLIHEIRENRIEIQIPSTVTALRRNLKGSHHFHNYSGEISAVDNLLKEIVVNIDGVKTLYVDELEDSKFGVGLKANTILSNTAGNTGVTFQFSAGDDLSGYTVGQRFNVSRPRYPGSFFPDPSQAFSVTSQRGVLGQTITAGSIVPTCNMTDASGIPNTVGKLVFNYGKPNEESLVTYFGRPNNTTIFLDPVYAFTKDHVAGESVNLILTPNQPPHPSGVDYSIYIVGVTAARVLAQRIVESIVAAGVVINWTVIGPVIDC